MLNRLKTDFEQYEIFYYSQAHRFPQVGIELNYKGKGFSALIEKDGQYLYCGLGMHECSPKLLPEIQDFLKPVLQDFPKFNLWWYGRKLVSYEEAYDEFKKLVDEVVLKIAKE